MQRLLSRAIAYSFYLLFFAVPLIFLPNTSELFEFNKIVLTYALTIIIVGLWLVRMAVTGKIIFIRSLLDIPLLLFLASQTLSTIFSIDPYTSFFGYYSRFHGGLLSTISYSLLYWAFVSNMTAKQTLKSLYSLLASATLVSLYGVAQHFGIDKDLWVQDVQNRVFSTLGQPNWLATWLIGLLPITWAFGLGKKKWWWVALSTLFFLTLIYTKSRSGFLGFALAWLIFWGTYFWQEVSRESRFYLIKQFAIYNLPLILLLLIFGSPWTQSVSQILNSQLVANQKPTVGTSLETGGTESGEIRKIVWKGAIEIWKHYPLLGTGVETFAYSYYNFRPAEHNMVSEWDFLYNKAHNEYLNLAANTGTVGLLAYLVFVAGSILQISKKAPILKFQKLDNSLGQLEIRSISNLQLALLSGLAGIFIANFFGFSVVPVALLTFLFPAFTVGLEQSARDTVHSKNFNITQKLLAAATLCTMLYALWATYRYWYADVLYASAKKSTDSGQYSQAAASLEKVIQNSPNNAIFWDELSQATAGLALKSAEAGASKEAATLANRAVGQSTKAIGLSPKNLNLYRNRASLFIQLSQITPGYLLEAVKTLEAAEKLAPTDAKIAYNLGLSYARTGQTDLATQTLERAINLKPNYRNARFALALIVLDKGNKKRAIEELTYILEKIDSKDELARQQLEEIR